MKRASALYDLWNSVPGRQIARGDSALTFTDFHGADDKWGVTYLYGCTALMISDPDFVVGTSIFSQSSVAKMIVIDDEPFITNGQLSRSES